jgi:Lar family restriction alleviation protein
MANDPKLLPCPFCGGAAQYKKLPDAVCASKYWWRPECPVCDAIMNNGWPTKEEAAEEWNRRTHRTPVADRWPLHRCLRDAIEEPTDWDIPGLLKDAAEALEKHIGTS